MLKGGWTLILVCLLVISGLSWAFAILSGPEGRPRVVVVASRPLKPHEKLSPIDLRYAIRRTTSPSDRIERLDQAVGSCTTTAIDEGRMVSWREVLPESKGEGSCATTAIFLELLKSSLSTEQGGDKTSVQHFLETLFTNNDSISFTQYSGLSEFRAEFVKELAHRLADNAADRVFGHGGRPAAGSGRSVTPTPAEAREQSIAPEPGR